MFPTRAIGRIKGPTPDQIGDYASRHHLPVSADQLAGYVAGVNAALEAFNRIDEMEPPVVPLKHHHRDPGRPPTSGEDPYNAFVRFCEVRGAAEGSLAGK